MILDALQPLIEYAYRTNCGKARWATGHARLNGTGDTALIVVCLAGSQSGPHQSDAAIARELFDLHQRATGAGC
jgi:hypothetical protein